MALTYKSLDTMKASRDSNSWTNQQKKDHCNAIAQFCPDITHISMDCFYDLPVYHSATYVQEWCDAIHDTGKKIWFRGVPAWDGLTAAQSITNISDLISDNTLWFENGDIFEYCPESHPYMFSDPPDNWNNSTVVWSQWHADMIAGADAAFSGISKSGVITTIQSIVSSYWTQGDVKASALTAFDNQISIDYYPLDLLDPVKAVKSMMNTLNTLHGTYPTADIIISEIGVMNTKNPTDTQQREILRAALNELSTLDYITGVSYWVSYNTSGGGGYTQLFQTNSRTVPRPALKTLSEFFTTGTCHKRMDVI